MPSPLHGTTIDHVELIVPDRHAAAAWYGSPRTGLEKWSTYIVGVALALCVIPICDEISIRLFWFMKSKRG